MSAATPVLLLGSISHELGGGGGGTQHGKNSHDALNLLRYVAWNRASVQASTHPAHPRNLRRVSPIPHTSDVLEEEGGGGVWNPKLCVPKMAQPDFLICKCQFFSMMVTLVGGQGGGSGGGVPLLLLWCTAILILPWEGRGSHVLTPSMHHSGAGGKLNSSESGIPPKPPDHTFDFRQKAFEQMLVILEVQRLGVPCGMRYMGDGGAASRR